MMNSTLMSQINNPMMMATDKLGDQLQNHAARVSNTSSFNNKGLTDYNDLNALQSLKHQSKTDKEGALDAAAKHFESIFVSMMITSMRDANKVFSEGNLLQSNQSDFYQQMFDSQMAVSLSTGKGIGLAEVIKKQLSKGVGPSDANTDSFSLSPKNKAFSLEDYAKQSFVTPVKVEKIEKTIDKIDEALKNIDLNAAGSAEMDFSSPDKYIESLYPYAKQAEQETGIDARLMLAQSALETGWGKHEILNADGSSSHNLFGIKAQRGWAGDSTNITTTEFRNGIAMKERADFRSYANYQESFMDYGRFLNSNARYERALEKANAPHEFAKELQDAGYATDPDYADKINRIIDRYMNIEELSALDEGAQKMNLGMGG
jgi:flagellar protein FlgJ